MATAWTTGTARHSQSLHQSRGGSPVADINGGWRSMTNLVHRDSDFLSPASSCERQEVTIGALDRPGTLRRRTVERLSHVTEEPLCVVPSDRHGRRSHGHVADPSRPPSDLAAPRLALVAPARPAPRLWSLPGSPLPAGRTSPDAR